jgi:2-polyprenyl-3-methyl-5-hydroxy-6-metoxy-1,4-benzoquinol methylase
MEKSEWFEEWFDTPFYHILYQDRDLEEATVFVTHLVEQLKIKKGAKILDLACGKGRHSKTLNNLGFDVTGSDLSVNSIAQAKIYENDSLRFVVQDMREPIPNEKFNVILNLFTSFGYFDQTEDNLVVLNACHKMLEKKGLLVIDFMNSDKVIHSLVPFETKTVEGITFSITREFDKTHICKSISFGHIGRVHAYTERVQALRKDDFEDLLKKSNFTIKKCYGGYELNPFHKENSDRLIIIAEAN